MKTQTKLISVGAVVALVAIFFFAFGPFVVVGSGDRGVVLNWGAFQGQILEPGLHFRIPLMQQVVKVNVQTQNLEIENSQAYSRDLQVVNVKSALNYNLDPKEVGYLYAEIGLGYENKILLPALEASVKQIYAKYNAEELLSKRSAVQSEIEDTIRETMKDKHIVIAHYALVNESFSVDFENAIEQKQVAEQSALKAKNDLDRIKIEADQRIAEATAEAEAIKIQADAIKAQGGEAYVQLKTVEKWDGHLPNQMIPGQTLPFLNVK